MPVRVAKVGDVTVVITTKFRECPEFGLVEDVTVDIPKKLDEAAIARRQQLAIMREGEMGKNPYTGDTSLNMLPDFPILDPALLTD